MSVGSRCRAMCRSRGRAVLLVPLVAAVVAGCSILGDSSGPPTADDPLAATPPAVSEIPTLDTVRGLALPTEAFKPTAAELGLVADAEVKLIADCMGRYGFTWAVPTASVSAVNQVDRLYGVSDLTTAQTYGYHLPSTPDRDSTVQQRASGAGTTHSPSELLVLTGSTAGDGRSGTPGSYLGQQIPEGGCAGQARRQVTGVDDIDPTHMADAIAVGMWEKSKSDPRVAAVVKSWSACMSEAGYDYPSPVGLTDRRWSISGPVTELEIRTAVTDVKCKQRTNLIGVWFTIESGYEQQAIQRHIEQLDQIKTLWMDAARRAAQILGRSAPHS